MPNEEQTNTNQQGESPAVASTPSQGSAPTTQDNSTLMGILAYIGILVIIPFLVAKDNPFVKFHVKQGIVLAVIGVCLWVVSEVIYMLAPIVMIANLGLLVLSIIGIVNVINKKEAELPLVGQLAVHVKI